MQKILTLVAIVIGLLAGGAETRAVDSHSKELRTILENGKQLEVLCQWTDAKSLYEQSMRIFPNDLALQSNFSRAKIMCDIQARFAYSSYVEEVRAMDAAKLRNVVAQLLRLQVTHFAYPMELQEMYRRELCGLSVALTSETFQEFVIPHATSESILDFRREMSRESQTRQIANFEDLVEATCQLGARASEKFGAKSSFFAMEAVCDLISALDQYSVVLIQPQYQNIRSNIYGKFVGIGVEIVQTSEGVKMDRVVPNSPAQRAGALRGDVFLAVNGVDTRNLPMEKVSKLLHGQVGTEVRLELQHGTEPPRTLTIVRTEIVTCSVEEIALLEGTDHVGYIRLHSFQNQTAKELEQAIQKLDAVGMKKLVIDLRDNPGGSMQAALESIALFVPEGQLIMYAKDSDHCTPYRAKSRKSWDVPLKILINAGSASASEIFSGSLQDMGRCEILGTRSYGKGVIQRLFPVSNSSFTLKLTTSSFYAPSGKTCHHVGITPDYYVAQTDHPNFALRLENSFEAEEPELPVLREAPVNEQVGASILARVNDSDLVLSTAIRRYEAQKE